MPKSSRRTLRAAEWLIPAGAALIIAVVTLFISSRQAAGPTDSSKPEFSTAAARAAWMKRQLRLAPPSEIRDAHFQVLEVRHPHTHMGPPETMYWLMAKVEIDPKDAPGWAALTKPSQSPRWSREGHPLQHPTAKWSLSPADFDGAAFYDPEPLLGTSRYGGYQAGRMVIPASGDAVYFWQHWR